MEFDTKYIKELAKIINENSLSEISLEDGQQTITVRKDAVYAASQVQSVAAASAAFLPAQTEAAAQSQPKGKAIVSPMVGTFYKAPSPESKPFAEVGQSVAAGDVVCIIEAMKLMNEIESEFAGKITQICVEDGQSVDYGQTLMYVE